MGDRTVSIPTQVTNEEAEQGQQDWNEYERQVELRKAEYEANGGGCVMAILPFVVAAISVAAWVAC